MFRIKYVKLNKKEKKVVIEKNVEVFMVGLVHFHLKNAAIFLIFESVSLVR